MTDRRRLNAEKRKPAILKAFYEVIENEGFENASIAKVATQAKVHASLVIHYFGSKENMILELVDLVVERYALLLQSLPENGTPAERLERILKLMWSRKWHETSGFSVVFSVLALTPRVPTVMNRVRELYAGYRQFLLEQMIVFKKEGIIKTRDVEGSVEAIMALSQGSHYFCRYFIDETSKSALDHHFQTMIETSKQILQADPRKMQ